MNDDLTALLMRAYQTRKRSQELELSLMIHSWRAEALVERAKQTLQEIKQGTARRRARFSEESLRIVAD